MGHAGYGTYSRRVLGLSPYAYWPLSESSGTAIQCLVDTAQNGTASSDVSAWPPGTGIGDGNTALYFDGTNDYIDVGTATLHSAFDGDEGTLFLWRKVDSAGVWTDSTTRICAYFRDGGYANLATIRKLNTANDFNWRYDAASTTEETTLTRSDTTWLPVAVTWSATDDEVAFYESGAQLSTSSGLGTWAGPTTVACIGSDNLATKWHGWLAHVALFGRALTESEISWISSI